MRIETIINQVIIAVAAPKTPSRNNAKCVRGALDQGLGDGGETSITKYYKINKDKDEAHFTILTERVDELIQEILEHTADDLVSTTFYDAPNFLILFSAVAFLKGYMPQSKITEGIEEAKEKGIDWDKAKTTLPLIAQAFDQDGEDGRYYSFVANTKSTTHRAASRKIRIEVIVRSICNDEAI